jgi:DNA-binding MarR family transcriptional regulator
MVEAIQKLFSLREALFEYEKELGIGDYSEIERSVLEFVVAQQRTTISKIMKHPYFSTHSLSSINRIVAKLLQTGVISSKQSKQDKRVMYLSFCLRNGN